MSLKLKVCGMRNVANIRAVAALGVDYMGFIFYGKSPRYVGEDLRLPADLPPGMQRVGVFVNADTDVMVSTAHRTGLQALQLHGQETAAQCQAIRDQGIKVIKVFSVDDTFDFNLTRAYEGSADLFLFDTKGRNPGGNAQTFDWSLLQRYNQAVPFFLSGGLDSRSVQALVSLRGMNLYGLDVNSGVEVAPAEKDPEKVKEIKTILNEIVDSF